jgi:hypothetical protein
MSDIDFAPGYPGLGPRFGRIRGVWYIQENEERVAIVEEGGSRGHWWILYHQVRGDWVELGTFLSVGNLVAHAPSLFAEVRDVAIPVDPLYSMLLVVEDSSDVRWWVVHGTFAGWRGPLVVFAAPRQAFVVPI